MAQRLIMERFCIYDCLLTIKVAAFWLRGESLSDFQYAFQDQIESSKVVNPEYYMHKVKLKKPSLSQVSVLSKELTYIYTFQKYFYQVQTRL